VAPPPPPPLKLSPQDPGEIQGKVMNAKVDAISDELK